MRISWLDPDVIAATRSALSPPDGDWQDLFDPVFELPPAPEGVPVEAWPRIAEHVARAERVSLVVREHGFEDARAEFAASRHAIELATLVAAAVQADELELELVESLLACEIDALVVYGNFLSLLVELCASRDQPRLVASYERFCAAFAATEADQPMWRDRVAAVRDGLANVYVICGRPDDAHALYQERHREATDDLVVALAASRAFLFSRNVGRAVQWLGIGAERAHQLGRPEMEAKLRAKVDSLRKRMS